MTAAGAAMRATGWPLARRPRTPRRPGFGCRPDLGLKTQLTAVDDRGSVITVDGSKALHKATASLAQRYTTA